MVQNLKTLSSFDLPLKKYKDEKDNPELESVECFSVDSLELDGKGNGKIYCKKNGLKSWNIIINRYIEDFNINRINPNP